MERNAGLVFNLDDQDPAALLTNAAKVTRLLNLSLLGLMHDDRSLHDADVPLLQELAWTADFYLTQAQQSIEPPKTEKPRPAPKTRPTARRDNVISLPERGSGHAS
jgi:hypothetical protein